MNLIDKYKISKLDSLIREANKIAIVVHTHPDGDAIGSALALTAYLCARVAARVIPVFPDNCPNSLSFIPGLNDVVSAEANLNLAETVLAESDLIFCLDLNSFGRLGRLEQSLSASGANKILIDHHLDPDKDKFCLMFSETQLSSTCELLFYILSEMPDMDNSASLALNVATPLMIGMTTDTNNFANSVYPSTLRMASLLLDAGVDRDDILSHLYNEYRENRLRAMGAFLERLMHITSDGVAYVVMMSEFLKKYDLQEGDTEGFVNLPLSIDAVKMSIFIREEGNLFRVSVRSKKGWSANQLAKQYFNGGGHECAAGGRLFVPKDIPTRDDAADYIEKVTARFLQSGTAD